MNDFPEKDAEIVVEKLLTVVFCGQCGYDNGENDDNLVEKSRGSCFVEMWTSFLCELFNSSNRSIYGKNSKFIG